MKVRSWCVTLASLGCAGSIAAAQSDFQPSPNIKQYVPRLVAMMSTAQSQHLKLWFAGKAKNWELAAYELGQLTDSLVEAAVLYPDIPVSNVTTLQDPLLSIADAITIGDSRRFAASMQSLTHGCNACHSSMGRSYIVMTIPTGQPSTNQIFAKPTERKK